MNNSHTYRALFFIITTLILTITACSPDKDETLVVTRHDSTSYGLGVAFAKKIPQNLKDNNIESVDFKYFMQGIIDYFDSSGNLQMTEEEITRVLNEEMNKQMVENQKQYEQDNFPNKKAGEAFLNENKKDRTIIELKNGLQYKIIDPGWGKLAPLVSDTIFISFKVYTINNELIYNSQDYSAMTKIYLGSAIPAFQEILPKIKTGGSVRIFASYEYAYGSEVYKKDKVKPYETLIFDVVVNKIRLNAERLNEFNRLNEIEPTGQQTNQQ